MDFKKIKSAVVILLTLAALLILAGCSNNNNNISDGGAEIENQDIVSDGAAADNGTPKLAYTSSTRAMAEKIRENYDGDIKLVRSGDPADAFHALMNGKANVIISETPDAVIWAEVDDGGFAWEMSTIVNDDQTPVYIITDSEASESAKALYNWIASDAGQSAIA